jgi:hypothetical protein
MEEGDAKASELAAIRSDARRLLNAFLENGEVGTFNGARGPAAYYAAALLKQEQFLEGVREARATPTSMHSQLAGTDRQAIEEFLLHASMRGRVKTLDSLLCQWLRLVEHIERDETSLVSEEYVNWLISRDYLEDAVSLVSPPSHGLLESRVHPVDDRFLAATQPRPTPIRSGLAWKPERWWWYRTPVTHPISRET